MSWFLRDGSAPCAFLCSASSCQYAKHAERYSRSMHCHESTQSGSEKSRTVGAVKTVTVVHNYGYNKFFIPLLSIFTMNDKFIRCIFMFTIFFYCCLCSLSPYMLGDVCKRSRGILHSPRRWSSKLGKQFVASAGLKINQTYASSA
ncbi:hypothetical protein OESDEN_23875 [Oesophagostomum dentatum]|uniref:Uncharacterized protein n=1 Tax=Oesophagostomum dentatum TaxID=61180 RepID=A0A0B1RZV0_OESDE|nr:hypothetical protein OESDEN_23875 [Oesophagostomum dentatum]